MRARSRLEQCCDIGDALSTLHPAILVGSRRFVLCSFRLAHGDPEALPTAVIAKAERDWIIGGIERLINGNHAVLPAGTARNFTGTEIWNDPAGQKPRHRIHKSDINDMAKPATRSTVQRGQRTERRILSRQHVGRRRSDLLWFASRLAGQIHDARIALGDEIVAWPIGTFAVEPEASDRDVDDIGAQLAHAFDVEAKLAGNARRLI